MTGKGVSDFKTLLLPGETRNINVLGNFVYCKEAENPTEIMIDGKTTLMLAGDKLRFDQPFKTVEIKNPDDLRPALITMVIGFGDFNRQIIQGEITVAPGVKGADGSFREDTRQEIEFSLAARLDTVPTSYLAGEVFRSAGPDPLDSDWTIETCQPFNGERYYLLWDNSGDYPTFLCRFDTEIGQLEPVSYGLNIQGNSRYLHLPTGIHVLPNRKVRRFSKDGDPVVLIDDAGFDSAIDTMYVIGGIITCFGKVDTVMSARRFTLLGDFIDETPLTIPGDETFAASRVMYDPVEDSLSVQDWPNGIYAAFDAYDLTFTFYHAQGVEPYLFGGKCETVGGITILYRSSIFEYYAVESFSIAFEGYADPVQCGAVQQLLKKTRNGTTSRADVTGIIVAGQMLLSGEIIRASLEVYFGLTLRGDYMDHVFSLELPKTEYSRPVATGGNSTSLLGSGIDDNFQFILPGVIKMTIDEGLFNNE